MNKPIPLEVVMQREHCTYSIRMPITLREQLDQLAKSEDRRPSQVVRRLIKFAYAEWERKFPQREDTYCGSPRISGV